MMSKKTKLLLFVNSVPVYNHTRTIPELQKLMGLSYPRVYDLVSKFTYVSGLAESNAKGLCFISKEAKDSTIQKIKKGEII